MQSTIKHLEDFVSKAGELAETKVELWKLRTVGKIAKTSSSLVSMIAIALLCFVAIIVISIGVAFWIGSEIGNVSYGFFIVGGFYVFVGLLVFLFRKYWIKNPVSNLIINNIIK